MHDDPHIAESLRRATPDAQPPGHFDVDEIIRRGRRLRRRNRIAVSGATAAGVLAATGAIAMVLTMSPEAPSAVVDEPEPADVRSEAVDIGEVAMSGYPWTEEWNYGFADPTIDDLGEAATTEFANLLAAAGIWDESESGPLGFNAEQRPGNYGQVFTRQYHLEVWGDQWAIPHPVFNLDVFLPGGWTDEPGPLTDQVFPKHLISQGAYYTDRAPEFESTELEDGRTLMTADHGCAYDVVVTYLNGSALRLSWEIGCEPGSEELYPVELEALVDAALGMPEIGYDASELEPIDELWEVPNGWLKAPSWESDGAADANAAADGAREVLDGLYPGATIDSVIPTENGIEYRGAVLLRAYRFGGTLPLQTTVDGEELPVSFEMRYFLPGGWIPGIGEGYHGQPYLLVCRADENSTCEEFERDGRTVAVEESPEGDYSVVVFHPDGWAATVWIGSAANAGMTLDEAVDMMLALPAPPYDADATPEIPAE